MMSTASSNGCTTIEKKRINDRIVSISQPHVRPIKRGKTGTDTEFGAKLSASLVDGYCFLDHLNWDNFNEGGDLKQQATAYRRRFGFYPKSIHADSIYRNRANIKFCKKNGIRLSGPALGRPPKDIELQKEVKKQTRQDEMDCIPIEGKFGQGKRRFSLSKIMCKLDCTSETAVAIAFLVMNLEKWLKVLLFCLILAPEKALYRLAGAFRGHFSLAAITSKPRNSLANFRALLIENQRFAYYSGSPKYNWLWRFCVILNGHY